MNCNYDVKSIYDTLYLDEKIINCYKEIEFFEEKNGGYAYHNFCHVKNVIAIVEQVLRELGYEEDFIYKAKIAGLLHDIGAVKGKADHANRSFLFAKEYFLRII